MNWPTDYLNQVLQGDCLAVLRTLPDESVNCCITSPPYWGLRDYGVDGQLGLEKTPEEHEYIFLLSKQSKYYYDAEAIAEQAQTPHSTGGLSRETRSEPTNKISGENHSGPGFITGDTRNRRSVWTVTTKPFKEAHFATFPPDLIEPMVLAGCPEKEIICNKCGIVLGYNNGTNGIYQMQKVWERMSCEGRPLASKAILQQAMQFFMDGKTQKDDKGMDVDEHGIQNDSLPRTPQPITGRICDGTQDRNGENTGEIFNIGGSGSSHKRKQDGQSTGKLIIDAIKISQSSTKATNQANPLPALWEENQIIGTCPECGGTIRIVRGIILDCFMGAGTTGTVAKMNYRNFIGIELNPAYIEMAEQRIAATLVNKKLEFK